MKTTMLLFRVYGNVFMVMLFRVMLVRVALFSTHHPFFVCVYGDVFMLMFRVVLFCKHHPFFVCVYGVVYVDKFVNSPTSLIYQMPVVECMMGANMDKVLLDKPNASMI
jgi:hypothetical protein